MIPPEPFEDVRRQRDEARAALERVTEERDAYEAALNGAATLASQWERDAKLQPNGNGIWTFDYAVGQLRQALRIPGATPIERGQSPEVAATGVVEAAREVACLFYITGTDASDLIGNAFQTFANLLERGR